MNNYQAIVNLPGHVEPEVRLLAGVFTDAIEQIRAGDDEAIQWLELCGHGVIEVLFPNLADDASTYLRNALSRAQAPKATSNTSAKAHTRSRPER